MNRNCVANERTQHTSFGIITWVVNEYMNVSDS